VHAVQLRSRLYDAAVCAAMAVAVAALLFYPSESVAAARDGLNLCLNSILPSLFPFFVLSAMVVQLGLADGLGRMLEPVMRPLFGVSGACSSALVLGFIGGYPVGAKTVISLYQNGSCSKAEAERMLAFCNNSGPAFILGVVGAGVFSSSRIGLLLYLAHAAASVAIGLLFRRRGAAARTASKPAAGRERGRAAGFSAAFTASVRSAFQSTLNICGFVIFFTVLIRLLFRSGILPALAGLLGTLLTPLGFDAAWAERLLTGLIELTSGVWTLQGVSGQLTAPVAMAAFMLGWAGLSIHCQVLSFLGGSGLSVRAYVLGKLLHGLLSAAMIFALGALRAFDAPVSAYLAEQIHGIAALRFGTAALYATFSAFGLALLFLALAKLSPKRVKNRAARDILNEKQRSGDRHERIRLQSRDHRGNVREMGRGASASSG